MPKPANKSLLTDNPYEVVENPDIDIVVELIGGINPAHDLIKKAGLTGFKLEEVYRSWIHVRKLRTIDLRKEPHPVV
mgnify:CR=1 FL=1